MDELPGTALDQFNWPSAAATDGRVLAVADTENHRIAIWTTFPTRSGQPADLILTGSDRADARGRSRVREPWAVALTNGRLLIANRGAVSILIYNAIPTKSDQAPDVILGGDYLGTPRFIGTDGKRLVVADYDPFSVHYGKRGSGTFVWNEFPTRTDQPYDFCISRWDLDTPLGPGQIPEAKGVGEQVRAVFLADGRMVGLGSGALYVWNQIPTKEKPRPDLIVGRTGGPSVGMFGVGDTGGIAIAGTTLYLSLMNDNKVAGYRTVPGRSGQLPDFVIGASSFTENTLSDHFIITNPIPLSNGKSLFVLSDADRTLNVWRNLPDRSAAQPDLVYTFPEAPQNLSFAGNGLVVTFRNVLLAWDRLPLNGERPTAAYAGQIGGVTFKELAGVAWDEKYFYLADFGAGKIYVWSGGVPTTGRTPTLAIDAPGVERVSSDGRYLVFHWSSGGPPQASGGIRVFEVAALERAAKPRDIAPTARAKWDIPGHVLVADGHLFVSDLYSSWGNRVFAWRHIDDAIAGKDPDVVLGAPDYEPVDKLATEDRLFGPQALSYDGSYLWVGEFKFSPMRLLRFSVSAQ